MVIREAPPCNGTDEFWMVLVVLIGSLLLLMKVRRLSNPSEIPSISTIVLEGYIESSDGSHCCSDLRGMGCAGGSPACQCSSDAPLVVAKSVHFELP